MDCDCIFNEWNVMMISAKNKRFQKKMKKRQMQEQSYKLQEHHNIYGIACGSKWPISNWKSSSRIDMLQNVDSVCSIYVFFISPFFLHLLWLCFAYSFHSNATDCNFESNIEAACSSSFTYIVWVESAVGS